MQVIDTATNAIVPEMPVGKRPWNMALTPDGKKLYVACGRSNAVAVIDTTDYSENRRDPRRRSAVGRRDPLTVSARCDGCACFAATLACGRHRCRRRSRPSVESPARRGHRARRRCQDRYAGHRGARATSRSSPAARSLVSDRRTSPISSTPMPAASASTLAIRQPVPERRHVSRLHGVAAARNAAGTFRVRRRRARQRGVRPTS